MTENFRDVMSVGAAILGSLGGAGVIVLAFSNWLGKVWASRMMAKEKQEHAKDLAGLRNELTKEVEQYKVQLKKSEFLFEKQYSAASELVALAAAVMPQKSHPDMDWEDACSDVAHNGVKNQGLVDDYLAKHGAVLSDKVKRLLQEASNSANDSSFEFHDREPTREALRLAEKYIEAIQKAEKAMIGEVRDQASI